MKIVLVKASSKGRPGARRNEPTLNFDRTGLIAASALLRALAQALFLPVLKQIADLRRDGLVILRHGGLDFGRVTSRTVDDHLCVAARGGELPVVVGIDPKWDSSSRPRAD
jgi:hypothetical protein